MRYRTKLNGSRALARALVCLLAIAWASPAYADSFYVAFNTMTNQCSVMITEPDGDTMIALESPFASYDDADAAMREMDKCSSHTGL